MRGRSPGGVSLLQSRYVVLIRQKKNDGTYAILSSIDQFKTLASVQDMRMEWLQSDDQNYKTRKN